jgi:hypothetical protein
LKAALHQKILQSVKRRGYRERESGPCETEDLALLYKQMAQFTPTLDDTGKRVLRAIREHGVAPGWQVMSEASVTADDLFKAASILIDMGLIKTSGALNPKEIEQAYFNILPSNARLTEMILSA